MLPETSIYQKVKKIFDWKIASCFVYIMKPKTHEPKHYHQAIEIEYVLKGSCQTHKEHRLYVYKTGQIHEVINDSNKPLVFICLTVPRESEGNTIYLTD